MFIDVTAANDTLCDTATTSAKLVVHGQLSIYTIVTSRSSLALAPKKIATLKKRCILSIGIENSLL